MIKIITIMYFTTNNLMQEMLFFFFFICMWLFMYASVFVWQIDFILQPAGCHLPRCLFIFYIALPYICIHKYTLVFNTCWHPLIIYRP